VAPDEASTNDLRSSKIKAGVATIPPERNWYWRGRGSLLRKWLFQINVVEPEPHLSPTAKRVMFNLLHHSNPTTGQRNPGFSEIAQMLAVSRRAVILAVQELESGGWIKPHPRRGKGKNLLSNDYEINPPDDEGVVQNFHQGGETDSPPGEHLKGVGCDESRVYTPNKSIERVNRTRKIPTTSAAQQDSAADEPAGQNNPAGSESLSAGSKQEPLPQEAAPPSPLVAISADNDALIEQRGDLYHRAQQVIGKNDWPLINLLIKTTGSVATARAVVEHASLQNSPRDYIAAVASKRARGGQQTGNASFLAGLLSAKEAHR
jgi:hypothetical protein